MTRINLKFSPEMESLIMQADIRYKVAIMGDVFSYSECLECLNDIMKEISAFGPHRKISSE